MPLRHRNWAEWLPGTYVLIGLAIVVLVALSFVDAWLDWRMIRTATLRSQMEQLRAESAQRAIGLGALLAAHNSHEEPWEKLRDVPWFREYWLAAHGEDDRRLYVAIVEDDGKIVMHSDPRQVGEHLGHGWYERRLPEIGIDVVRVEGGPLAGVRPAFDVSVPLAVAGAPRGELHAGLDAWWMEGQLAQQQRRLLLHWSWLTGVAVVASALAIGCLVRFARRDRRAADLLARQSQERALQLANLGAGLAHEVRNPLHALRINLHILRRAMERRVGLSEEELLATAQESDTAIDRIEAVLRNLLQFVEPSAGTVVQVDLAEETRTALGLLADGFRRDQIVVDDAQCRQAAPISIDVTRLRQILLNLLSFAQLRAGKQGRLEVAVSASDTAAELTIAHGGPPLTAEQAACCFEPFLSPVETGSGLELAVVRAQAALAGGSVRYERSASDGNRLILWFPRARGAVQGATT